MFLNIYYDACHVTLCYVRYSGRPRQKHFRVFLLALGEFLQRRRQDVHGRCQGSLHGDGQGEDFGCTQEASTWNSGECICNAT